MAIRQRTSGMRKKEDKTMTEREMNGTPWILPEFARVFGNAAGRAVTEEADSGFTHVTLIAEKEARDETSVSLCLNFVPDYIYTPHLAPAEGMAAAQHVFRSPALIAMGEEKTVILIPDVRALKDGEEPAFLDFDADHRTMTYGRSRTAVTDHILYQKVPGAFFPAGSTLSFYLLTADERLPDPYRKVLSFLWRHFGAADAKLAYADRPDYRVFCDRTYRWAYGSWKDVCFQTFSVNGKEVGAPMMIVSALQSPNHDGEKLQLERVAIWNQAWFCSLRSASGLYRYAKMTGNGEYLRYAEMTKELALSFPQEDGLFDAVIAPRDGKNWEDRFFGNSNRNPFDGRLETAPRHILDMAFTAYYMLIWYEELERDPRLLAYVTPFASRLLRLQAKDGFFPAWIGKDGKPMGVLDRSPESAMPAAFLLRFSRLTGRTDARDAALRALDAIRQEIVPEDRWEDFETYWSCCRYWSDHVGERVPRSGVFKQCNFSMYFTALGMMEAWKTTGDRTWLLAGQEVLDRMLTYQSSFQPDGLPVAVVGGFGVMNADAELNDARQSLFAPLILEYGRELGTEEYLERGRAALDAAFSMMFCPENPSTAAQWKKCWGFFGEEDYGFMMENYGHNGAVDREGLGIGIFTIYDWGNGAAAEGWLRADALGLLGPA